MIQESNNQKKGPMIEFIKRVLVVDDEAEFVKTVERHLKREGFFLDSACDGNDARHKIQYAFLKGFPFDLVITDVVMPNLGGIGLIKWIKKAHPNTSVLVTSGFVDNDMTMETIRPEMDCYAEKPFTPKKMMQLIGSIDRKRRRWQQRNRKENLKGQQAN